MIPLVDVYYPGDDRPRPPFLLVWALERVLPPAPNGNRWTFWKQVPINLIAVDPAEATRLIREQGFYLQ